MSWGNVFIRNGSLKRDPSKDWMYSNYHFEMCLMAGTD